jgi:hypothetical protein
MKSSGFSFKQVVLLLITNKVQYLCLPLQIQERGFGDSLV